MSQARDRVWRDVLEGRVDDVPQFILEYIYYFGCADDDITDMVTTYFDRLDEEP